MLLSGGKSDVVLILQLALIWASFLSILPLLMAARPENGREPIPSPVPRLALVFIPVAIVMSVTSGMRAGAPSAASFRKRVEKALRRSITGLLVGTAVIYAVTVVLGAPITTLVPETLVFSSLVAALTFLPVWISSRHPLRAFSSWLQGGSPPAHEVGVMIPAAACGAGAWLGAIPLCLDWERPWQAWPLPLCVGGLLGFSAGTALVLGMNGWIRLRRRLGTEVSPGAKWS